MILTSDFRPEVEILSFRACTMHPDIIGTVDRSLWTWLWGDTMFHRNVFLVLCLFFFTWAILFYGLFCFAYFLLIVVSLVVSISVIKCLE